MIVGVLQAELRIDWAASLKDKRTVTRSLKDRLSRSYRVSVAEVGAQDIHNALLLGVAVAASSGAQANAVLDTVQRALDTEHDAELVSCQRELLRGWAGELSGAAFTTDEHDDLAREMHQHAINPGQTDPGQTGAGQTGSGQTGSNPIALDIIGPDTTDGEDAA